MKAVQLSNNGKKLDVEQNLLGPEETDPSPDRMEADHKHPDNKLLESLEIEENLKEVKVESKPNEKVKTVWDTFFGIIIMSVSVILFALSTTTWKIAYMNNHNLTGLDYLLVRSITLVISSFIQAWSLKVNLLDIKKEGRLWLFLRCLFGGIAAPCFYVALKFLPSSKATLISNFYPLLVTIAWYFWLKEQITKYDVIALVGAFIGVIILNINKTTSSKINTTDELIYLGVILCLINTFLGMGVTISIKLMNKHLHFIFNPSYFSFTLFGMSMAMLVIYPAIYNFEYYDMVSVIWFVVSGIIHYIAQTLWSLAFKYEDASKITPLNYTIGIYLLGFDILLFGYNFSLTDLIGSGLVILFLLLPILVKLYSMKKDK